MNASTIVGWSHDFALQGLQPSDEVGAVVVELVVWDDEPESPFDGVERIELTVNGVVVSGPDIGGSAAEPYRYSVRLPWLECRAGFDGRLDMRLRTVGIGNEPAGDMFFGAATTTLQRGRFQATVLDNGGFEHGFDGWSCNHPACTTAAQASTWSDVKRLFRTP